MGVTFVANAVVSSGTPIALSQIFQINPASNNPAYIILNAVDRNDYAFGAVSATGSLLGKGTSVNLGFFDGDIREAGIVFQYQLLTGRYYSSSLGYLDQVVYSPALSAGDVTDISLFASTSAGFANAYAPNALALMQLDPSGYLGTTTIVTQPSIAAETPSQATPDRIASVAESFVGQVCNINGCWILASTIAAEAGASLPLQTVADLPGQTNGEWFVAYNGPSGAGGNWQSAVRTGDVIVYVTSSGNGHVATCVAGEGVSATLIDNQAVVGPNGEIVNIAVNGHSDDIIIESPHSALQEWSGVQGSSVVIYRLDTPVMTTTENAATIAAGSVLNLSSLFSAIDPASSPILSYQVSIRNHNDSLDVAGASGLGYSISNPITINSLSQASFSAGLLGGSDVIAVRAFNGSYWGDWKTISLQILAPPQNVSVASSSASAAAASSPSVSPAATSAPTSIGLSPTPNPTQTNILSLSQGGQTDGNTNTASVSGNVVNVYRFFDSLDGTHFYTASGAERDSLLAARSDMIYEGIGMTARSSPDMDGAAEPVFRFFDTANGTHFYTASSTERDSLLATRPDLTSEGISFYEDASQQNGGSPVYRFFDTQYGTHLYTNNAHEAGVIQATRSDLSAEGIAFYAN